MSEASLRQVQSWFPEMTLESVRRRFRTNLELGDGEPFCEDRLYGAPEELKPFQIGAVKFFGHNPCQRCVVPTRDPDTAQAVADFQKKFMQLRREQLPALGEHTTFQSFLSVRREYFHSPDRSGETVAARRWVGALTFRFRFDRSEQFATTISTGVIFR